MTADLNYCFIRFELADDGGLAVYGVAVRPFACWDRGYESRWWGIDICLL